MLSDTSVLKGCMELKKAGWSDQAQQIRMKYRKSDGLLWTDISVIFCDLGWDWESGDKSGLWSHS